MTTTSTTATIVAALIGAAAALAKKVLPLPKPKPEYITRAEFHQSMDAVRDRISASHLALAEKMEQEHTRMLGAIERQGANVERRLDQLESGLARLDERTKSRNEPVV